VIKFLSYRVLPVRLDWVSGRDLSWQECATRGVRRARRCEIRGSGYADRMYNGISAGSHHTPWRLLGAKIARRRLNLSLENTNWGMSTA